MSFRKDFLFGYTLATLSFFTITPKIELNKLYIVDIYNTSKFSFWKANLIMASNSVFTVSLAGKHNDCKLNRECASATRMKTKMLQQSAHYLRKKWNTDCTWRSQTFVVMIWFFSSWKTNTIIVISITAVRRKHYSSCSFVIQTLIWKYTMDFL